MARFEPAKGIDERVALMHLDTANDLADRIADLARANAPDAAVWITAHDERVRETHVKADAQTIPANIRFILDKVRAGTGTELARAPRDPNLKRDNREGCRCERVVVPGVVAASIQTQQAAPVGAEVHAQVYTRFNRAAESNHPSSPDSGGGWMTDAVTTVEATLRTRD